MHSEGLCRYPTRAVDHGPARVSGRNLCYAEAVRTVGRNVDRWIFRTQVATPYRSEERVVAGKASSDILLYAPDYLPPSASALQSQS